ncbi:hypothetical protein L1987_59677 [Smallanthus sonchifolius]|uniref:Uncharacterized protein n=1 Tax=Smallanthus sonchifolius TaxID=185202 RepID=A0ACB9D5W1_9ASTR|nr:hypothetical protein L1987_59677 [Smallanthus sonchifolius]
MDGTLGLLGRTTGAGDVGGGGVRPGGSILTKSKNKANNHNMSIEDSSPYPVDDNDDDGGDLELGLGLSIGGGLKKKEESFRILTSQDSPILKPSCSSSSSSSSSIVGTKRTAIHSVSPPNATSVVGWPPIRKAHRVSILANRIKSDNEEFSSRPKTKNTTNGHHLTVKVNMDGTLIGRKVDLYAHTSYETLAQTLENMFYGRWSSTEAIGSSRLLDGTFEFVLTYEDKDGDWMLVGDVPWQMFLSSVKRLRIHRNPKMQH